MLWISDILFFEEVKSNKIKGGGGPDNRGRGIVSNNNSLTSQYTPKYILVVLVFRIANDRGKNIEFCCAISGKAYKKTRTPENTVRLFLGTVQNPNCKNCVLGVSIRSVIGIWSQITAYIGAHLNICSSVCRWTKRNGCLSKGFKHLRS